MSQVRGSWCCYWVTFKCAPPAGANGQVTYGGLSGGPFSIHPQTGLIVTTHPLDREEQEQHVLMGMAVLVRGREQQALGRERWRAQSRQIHFLCCWDRAALQGGQGMGSNGGLWSTRSCWVI